MGHSSAHFNTIYFVLTACPAGNIVDPTLKTCVACTTAGQAPNADFSACEGKAY